jgi:hypothetical protein
MDSYSAHFAWLSQIGQFSGTFVEQLRSILFGLAIFILGLVVSEVVRYISTAILSVLQWDAFCRRTGLADLLRKVRPKLTPSAAAGEILWWVSLATFTLKAAERLDLPWISWLGHAYFQVLPMALQAGLILLAAGLAARWLASGILLLTAHPAALLAAGLMQITILALGLYSALQVLGWEKDLILPLTLILFAGAVLAVGLAWALHRGRWLRPVIRIHDSEEGF